ncbi:sel1 repeat family protein [Sphingobium phenoxybenzoativorans]|uniref:Sel1 repeat family protein n=1 Tax=Sphingobium phenoxybenzoativorans TaxID=1592790 RepID=A0A975K7Z1_9SPHN|nr:SEL1-like repeat protein [Sphingobium phenoxybenzoativorans]QUT06049.1 sel1 repeat family protein [Sphingobium phenoxybenzoativorans]
MGISIKSAEFLLASRMAEAASGCADACYDLGMAYSCGTGGVDVDLIAAHKWFNLAALRGMEEAQYCRADVAEEMSGREIAEAQRLARAFIAETGRRAA